MGATLKFNCGINVPPVFIITPPRPRTASVFTVVIAECTDCAVVKDVPKTFGPVSNAIPVVAVPAIDMPVYWIADGFAVPPNTIEIRCDVAVVGLVNI